MEQSESNRKRNQNSQNRALWFVSIIFILVLCGAVVGSVMAIRSAKVSMIRDVERELETQARNRVAALTVWYGGLQSEVDHLAGGDMFRLYASEINNLGRDATPLLQAQTSDDSAQEEGDLKALAVQLPMMRKVLQDFVTRSKFLSGRMLNRSLQTYISTDSLRPLTDSQERAASVAFKMGKTVTQPVRQTTEGLVMDMAQPIFAPDYASVPDGKPVAVLLLTLDVTNRLAEIISEPEAAGEATRILQRAKGELEELLPGAPEAIQVRSGWTITPEDRLPMQERRLPGMEEPVYLLGIDVPDLPWIVVQEIQTSKAEESFRRYRNEIILVTIISTTVIVFFLGLIWWRLVGRRERAVFEEMAQLYQTVNQQKQLLGSINSTLPDGIILTDQHNVIQYANKAFAERVDRDPEMLRGLPTDAVLFPDVIDPFRKHINTVLSSGESTNFTVAVLGQGGKKHYQVVCAPFRDEEGLLTGVVSVLRDITQIVEAQERNQIMVQQTINVLVRAIEAVDPYLRGQSAQTGLLAGYLVQKLKLGPADDNTVRIAANLFQIGMIQLPHNLINKQGHLTPEERTMLERHVEYARSALSGIDFGLPVVEAISQMHERMDGSGYPNHLIGDQIGIHGRILAVANTFCALVRPRSYREARSVEDALTILSTEPPQYDPHIVALLREFLRTPSGKTFLHDLLGEEKTA